MNGWSKLGLLLLYVMVYGALSFVLSSDPMAGVNAVDSTIPPCINVLHEPVIEPGNAVPSRWNVTVSPCWYGYSSEGMFGVTVAPNSSPSDTWSVSPAIVSLGDVLVGSGRVAEFNVSVPASTQAGFYDQSFRVNYTDAGGFSRSQNASGTVKVSTIMDPSGLSLTLRLLPETGEPELLVASLATINGVPVSDALVEVCGYFSTRGPNWTRVASLATDAEGIDTLPLVEMVRYRTAAAIYSRSTQGCGSLGVIGKTSDYVATSIPLPPPKVPLLLLATIMFPALLFQGLGALAIRSRILALPLSLRKLSPVVPSFLGMLGGAVGVLMLVLVRPYPIPQDPFVCTACVPLPVTLAALGSVFSIAGGLVARLFFKRTGALLLLFGGSLPVYGEMVGQLIYSTSYGWYLLWTLLPIAGGVFMIRKSLAMPFILLGDRRPMYLGIVAGLWGLAGFQIAWFGLAMAGVHGALPPPFANVYLLGWLGSSLLAIFAALLTRMSMRAGTLMLLAAFNAILAVMVVYWQSLSAAYGLPTLSLSLLAVFAFWYGWIALILVAGMFGLATWLRRRV